MVVLLELIIMVPAIIAFLSFIIHCWLANRSDSGLFAYGMLIAAAMTVSTVAASLGPADPYAQATIDAGVLVAGALAFAASGWLLFAFRVAGDAGER